MHGAAVFGKLADRFGISAAILVFIVITVKLLGNTDTQDDFVGVSELHLVLRTRRADHPHMRQSALGADQRHHLLGRVLPGLRQGRMNLQLMTGPEQDFDARLRQVHVPDGNRHRDDGGRLLDLCRSLVHRGPSVLATLSFFSASATTRQAATKLSGFREMESIPASTRKAAKSG